MFTDEQSQDAHADRWKHTFMLCACMFQCQMLCWYEGLYFCVCAMKDKGGFYAFFKSQIMPFTIFCLHGLQKTLLGRMGGKMSVDIWRRCFYLNFPQGLLVFKQTELSICHTTVTFKSQFNHLLFEVLLVFLIPVVTEGNNVMSQSSVQRNI